MHEQRYFPIEIKCKTQISKNDARGICAFIDTYPALDIPLGLILYPGDDVFFVSDKVLALPYLAILS